MKHLCSIFYHLRQVNDGDYVFVRCVSVSVCVCVSVRSGPVNQTSLKQLKLRTSNLTRMFQGQSGHALLQLFREGEVVRVT